MTVFSVHSAWRVASYGLDEAHLPSDIWAIRYKKGDISKYNGLGLMFISELSSPCRFIELLVHYYAQCNDLFQAYEPGTRYNCLIMSFNVCQLCVKVHTYQVALAEYFYGMPTVHKHRELLTLDHALTRKFTHAQYHWNIVGGIVYRNRKRHQSWLRVGCRKKKHRLTNCLQPSREETKKNLSDS